MLRKVTIFFNPLGERKHSLTYGYNFLQIASLSNIDITLFDLINSFKSNNLLVFIFSISVLSFSLYVIYPYYPYTASPCIMTWKKGNDYVHLNRLPTSYRINGLYLRPEKIWEMICPRLLLS